MALPDVLGQHRRRALTELGAMPAEGGFGFVQLATAGHRSSKDRGARSTAVASCCKRLISASKSVIVFMDPSPMRFDESIAFRWASSMARNRTSSICIIGLRFIANGATP
jgi:hypothetical protein